MHRRAVSQAASVSRASVPLISAAPSDAQTPASVPPPPTTAQPPPAPVTIVVTSILPPAPASTPTTTSATAVYTTITHVLTTIPTSSPMPILTAPRETTSGSIVQAVTTSTPSRSSTARASASSLGSAGPHKPKNNLIGKYIGYAIGAVFFLTLISSFFSAWRKHRKYVRRRPRGSTFVGTRLSSGQSSPQKRSMSQALMPRSASNRSFDAYALFTTSPTSPAPVYPSHSQLLIRSRELSVSPTMVRPLPPTPSPNYTIRSEDATFYPVDPREYSQYSPFGASSSGSSTQTSRDAMK